ncbi:hypothetical protein CALVIDRAFT_97589 [Calocera viscosa TUFC12733]|uniref:Uncharacterized protein n=1 Tax=Calocera viscosa (strain TUFC12733) TaxID=1330018 RepID=A0A167MJ75_CALVF|nr:hypothetical protein CALVIDRAFT_97589 [Calocera viscosa TUFC12733]
MPPMAIKLLRTPLASLCLPSPCWKSQAMGTGQHPGERAALLSHAIDLCTTLRDTLERIGPSRWTRSADFLSADEYAIVSHVHDLESTLHRRLQQISEKRNEALAPVSRLPDDVLRIIFKHMLTPMAAKERVFSHLDNWLTTLTSRVSRRWRAVALDTATLWAHVSFFHPKYVAVSDSDPIHPWYGTAMTLDRVSMRNVERSKLALLRVGMNLPAGPGVPEMVREYLRTCSGRVGELAVSAQTGTENALGAAVQCVAHTAGVLRCFYLNTGQAGNDVDGHEAIDQLLSLKLPALVEVEFISVPLPLRHQREYTALLGCRRLDLRLYDSIGFSPARLLSLLKCAPALEDLVITLSFHQNPPRLEPDEPDECLLLPELRSITYSFTNARALPFKLAYLSAPKVGRLAFHYLEYIPPRDNEELWDLYTADIRAFLEASVRLGGSPPPVRMLASKGGVINRLHDILPALPQLELLQVDFNQRSMADSELEITTFLDKLSSPRYSEELGIQTSTSYVCPRLRVLESLTAATPSLLRPLIQLAARRKGAGIPLTRVRMDRWPQGWASEDGRTHMPDTPEEQYALERALAREVDTLECGGYRWEWGEVPHGQIDDRGGWNKVADLNGHQHPSPFPSWSSM